MSTISLESTVGQLVAEQPARSRVFEQFGIDYCCGGRRPLAAACTEKGVDTQELLSRLAEIDAVSTAPERDWTKASLTELADHVVSAHHDYLREALPRLTALTEKVNRAHGDRDPRLGDLRVVFNRFRADLESHMSKEELILFPLCREMDGAETRPRFHCGSVQNPIRVMIAEHDDAGEDLQKMRELTDGYTPPQGACNTYRAMLQALEELESDMHQHVHLENNILFPRATAAESNLPANA